MEDRPLVAVLMSGGVDSSVTAAILKEQGYDIFGIFAKTWSDPIKGVEHCPWVEDERFVSLTASKLGIPFYVVNVEDEYKKQVIDYFFAEYYAGRTPNPDVLCNRQIKFGVLFDLAVRLGAEKIATGHYARLHQKIPNSKFQITNKLQKAKNPKQEIQLFRGVDSNKDQSYFLWDVKRQVLDKLIFPIGELEKSEVRKLAKRYVLPSAERHDSQGICFLGPVSVKDFLLTKIKPKKGDVVLTDGTKVGEHDGVWFYTIGQRHGVDQIPNSKIQNPKWGTDRPPLYVVGKDIKKNILVVAPEGDKALEKDRFVAKNINWLVDNPKDFIRKSISCQVRYRQKPVACQITILKDKVEVELASPIRAVTPGQSVVWYDEDVVLGGGVID